MVYTSYVKWRKSLLLKRLNSVYCLLNKHDVIVELLFISSHSSFISPYSIRAKLYTCNMLKITKIPLQKKNMDISKLNTNKPFRPPSLTLCGCLMLTDIMLTFWTAIGVYLKFTDWWKHTQYKFLIDKK